MTAKVPAYTEAQKKKTVSKFYTTTQTAFFAEFPERKRWYPEKDEKDPLTSEEKKIVDQHVQERKKVRV